MKKMLHINKRLISQDTAPYIIAELSANHNGSIETAKKSIAAAKECGVNAIKLQTYTPETMTINCNKKDFIIKGGLWDGYTLYELYEEAHTPFEWHEELFRYAKKIGIDIFSSPFDETAVDLLEELKTPAYKIASFELCDIPLIKYVASKNKPILISTGLASIREIDEAINTIIKSNNHKILLFHCISSYPAPIQDANLKNIQYLRDRYNVEIGLSDHTLGNTAAIASIALGASAIEKHFTLSRNDQGPDSKFSIEPDELKALVRSVNDCYVGLGSKRFKRSKSEEENKVFRRSIYFIKDLKAGSIINKDNIRRIRPGNGLEPKFFDEILGKRIINDVERGDPVKLKNIE